MMKEKNAISQIADTLYKAACDASDMTQDRNAEEYELKKKIACRIRELRQADRRTQDEISEKINCPLMTYRGYENMHSNIPLVYLVRLARYYDVSLDYIAGETDNRKGKCAEVTEETTTDANSLEQRIEQLEERLKKLETQA